MRVDIICDGKQINASTVRLGSPSGLVIESGGLEGWYGSTAPQQSGTSIPAGGATFPDTLTPQSRVVTLHLVSDSSSEVEAAQYVDLLSGFFGKPLTLTVTDASGTRTAEGYLSDAPTVEFTPYQRKLLIDLIITCPDPNKYGMWTRLDGTGDFGILLGGNAPSYPTIEATGQCTALSISVNGHQVKWTGSGGVSIDLKYATVTKGTITVDDSSPLLPGQNYITVSATGADTVTTKYRPAWR